ncbi:MAG: MmgE/PrpD family protein [Actinomycetota bacterium]
MAETRELASFVASLDTSSIPDDVQHQAKRCLIDWLGVALAGSQDPGVGPMLATVERVGGKGPAAVLGTDLTASQPFAALANGFAAHVLDFDDTFQPSRTTVHGSAPVWPVLMALGQGRMLQGRRALEAFVAGFETECRVGLAAGPRHYERGWHVTGTAGHFGAAAAASRALGFDRAQTAAALGTAGTQAAGVKEVYGTMGKALHPGKAAMDGLLSVLLTESGFTATHSILEGKRGFLNVQSDDPQPVWLTRDLGSTWWLRENSFKPYSCGSLTHPTIEAVLHLRAEHAITPDEVDGAEATVHSYVSWVTAKEEPATGLEGKFSIFHAVAVALLDGRALPRQFTDERVNAPDVAELRKRVRIVVDDDLPKEGARVVIALKDGRRLSHEVPRNKGSADNPLSDIDLEQKYLDLASAVIGAADARAVAKDCWRLEDLDDLSEIIERCTKAISPT